MRFTKDTRVVGFSPPADQSKLFKQGAPERYHLLGIKPSGASSLEIFVMTRAYLHDRIYGHQKTRAAEMLLERLLRQSLMHLKTNMAWDEAAILRLMFDPSPQRCQASWREIPHGSQEGSVFDVWQSEVQSLMPRGAPFDGFVECGKRVSPTCLVHFDRNRYSVPASLANHRVSLRVYPDRLVVVAEGQVICEHARLIERSHHVPGRTIYDSRHYLSVIQRKPGTLRNGAPFADFPEAFRQLQRHLLKQPGGDREMVEILALILHHDEQAVLCAVELALSDGAPTKTHVLNLLHRLIDGKSAPDSTIAARAALALNREPRADVERYDALRDKLTEVRHAS